MKTKWIIVTGGVLSGLGKGIVCASLGRFFVQKYKILPIKCDGYLNVDPGTMNPTEHGEVFVLEDGKEVDMDFGHYERFLNIKCRAEYNLTSGKIFNILIGNERKGKYLGKTVQMIPHATDEIKNILLKLAGKNKADIAIVEIGGTIGDIENELFIEAVRQLKADVGEGNIFYAHLTYVPVLGAVGEQKTKPTQQSMNLLRERGIQPDIIICRSEKPLTKKSKSKIALFANLKEKEVISNPDAETVYDIPLFFEEQGVQKILKEKLNLKELKYNFKKWKMLVKNIKKPEKKINIAICGKYTELADSYASIIESLKHASAHTKTEINIKQIETTDIDSKKIKSILESIDGIIIPGGFGARGTEGKIKVIKYARENNIPFLGLCLGLQLAVVEFARSIGLKNANSSELNPKTKYPVIDILPEQKKLMEEKKYGATMRLGSYPAKIKKGSLVQKLYGKTLVYERHRHRYEVNPKYHKILQKKGLVFSGMSPDKRLVEFIELTDKKFFVATQAHPEFTSRFEKPNPLFLGFVKACLK